MVYLKPLYSRLDRLAQRQSSPFSTEAQQEHVKFYFSKSRIFIKKKIGTENYRDYIIHRRLCRPRSSGGHLRILLIDLKHVE